MFRIVIVMDFYVLDLCYGLCYGFLGDLYLTFNSPHIDKEGEFLGFLILSWYWLMVVRKK